MAEFAKAAVKGAQNIQVSLQTDLAEPQNFAIDSTNTLVLQTVELPKKPSWIAISAEGEGSALATISWTYYVKNTSGDAFRMSVQTSRGQDDFTMNVCARWVESMIINLMSRRIGSKFMAVTY